MEHRGTNLAEGLVIDEGIDQNTGVGTRWYFQGGELMVERYQDLEAELEYCRMMREALAGQPWGEGKPVGRIPPLYYDKILNAPGDKRDRSKAVKAFFKEYPAFCYYPDYLKD